MIKTTKTNLSFALRSVTKVMANAPAVPILGFCRFQMSGEHLYVDAGNVQNHAFARIPAEGKEMVGCIDPKLLLGLLPALPDEIELKPVKNKLQVKRPKGNALLATMDADKFPDAPAAKDAGQWVKFPRESVREMIKVLLCGTEETSVTPRLWQNVALIRCNGDTYTAVASDGQKTAVAEGKCEGEGGSEVLIPITALRALYAIVEDSQLESVEHIEIGQDERRVWVRLGDGLRLMFTKIQCEFPDIFGKVLDKLKFSRTATLQSEQVVQALLLARAITGKEDSAFRLEAKKDTLTFATEAKDRGEATETVDVKTSGGFKPFVTGYNGDFLYPVFQQVEGEVELQFSEMGSAEPKNYPLMVVHQGKNVKASWLIQSRHIYPGSPPVKQAEKVSEAV